MGQRTWLIGIGALITLALMVSPVAAKSKRPKTMEALVNRALKAVTTGDARAYKRLLYLPSHGVKLCPSLFKQRGWNTSKAEQKRRNKRLRTKVDGALADCAKMGDWSKAKALHFSGGIQGRRRTACKKSVVFEFKEVKVLYRLGATHVELRLRTPGKVNGKFGFMKAPRCRLLPKNAHAWHRVLTLGAPCALKRASTSASDESWRPKADPAERNRVNRAIEICSDKGRIAGVYSFLHLQDRSYRSLVLEEKQLGKMPSYDIRTISLEGDILRVRYQDCVRCKGRSGWTFIGRVSTLPKQELLALQVLLGIPAKVGPMRKPAAWRKHYKK